MIGQENIGNMFNLSDYNLTRWIDDWASAAQGSYYTQRVYIYRRDAGSETLCDYNPPTDDNSIINGGEWYRISTNDPSYYPNSAQYEAALQNSEGYAGWSRERVRQLNASGDGFSYSIYYSPLAASKSQSRGMSRKKSMRPSLTAIVWTGTRSWLR